MPKPVSDDGPKEAGLSIRTNRALRDRLEAAAKEHGRSLAQEVERRLKTSFEVNADASGEQWSDVTRNYARIVGLVLHRIDQVSGRRWIETPEGVAAALAGVERVFASTNRLGLGEPRDGDHLAAVATSIADYLTFKTEEISDLENQSVLKS